MEPAYSGRSEQLSGNSIKGLKNEIENFTDKKVGLVAPGVISGIGIVSGAAAAAASVYAIPLAVVIGVSSAVVFPVSLAVLGVAIIATVIGVGILITRRKNNFTLNKQISSLNKQYIESAVQFKRAKDNHCSVEELEKIDNRQQNEIYIKYFVEEYLNEKTLGENTDGIPLIELLEQDLKKRG